MKYILTILLVFIISPSFSQHNEHEEIKEHEEIFIIDYSNNEKVKNLGEHPQLTLRIDSIEMGNQKVEVNFKFKGKIKTQTGLLELNDSIGINIIFLKLKILNKQEFFYSEIFYRKEKDGNWKEIYGIQMYTLMPGSYTDGWGGVGYRGETNSFWYKMYSKFE